MKIIGWAMSAAIAAFAAPAFAGDLTVTLTGVSDAGGQMVVSLQTRDQFMKPAGVNGAFGAAVPGTQTFIVRNVPAGDYAVMVMHDADSDWQMAYGPDRKPREGWTMSGKVDPAHKPTFDATKITVPADGGAVTLPMIYPK